VTIQDFLRSFRKCNDANPLVSGTRRVQKILKILSREKNIGFKG